MRSKLLRRGGGSATGVHISDFVPVGRFSICTISKSNVRPLTCRDASSHWYEGGTKGVGHFPYTFVWPLAYSPLFMR